MRCVQGDLPTQLNCFLDELKLLAFLISTLFSIYNFSKYYTNEKMKEPENPAHCSSLINNVLVLRHSGNLARQLLTTMYTAFKQYGAVK